jgi:hypothetical protein
MIDIIDEIPSMLVIVLWSVLAASTNNGIIGLIGLAIAYRHYAKKRKSRLAR